MTPFKLGTNIMPKMLMNIGALLDIPTGVIVIGKNGESIINGGLSNITGIVGAGNNFKSTISHYMILSAADHVAEAYETQIATYDTEINVHLDRVEDLASGFKHLPHPILMAETPTWNITDKSMTLANTWAVELNKYIEDKIKNKSLDVEYQAFKDPYTKNTLVAKIPTFAEIDSLTEFEPESSVEMLGDDLDTSSTNTYAMKQGLFKTKFLSQLPRLCNTSNTNMIVTAHIGVKIDMATSPAMYQQPTKALQYLKSGDVIKGVGPKFNYLTTTAWFAHTATVLKNQTTKLAEYPLNGNDKIETDLNVVRLTSLRSKSGVSGCTVELVVSQTQGVLPTLTEFHFIKENGRYGIEGNNIHYNILMYPSVSINRMNVRAKIDNDPRLRRAINITAELLQLWIYHRSLEDVGLLCSPKELYDDLTKMGYDWNILLDTRGYWTINQYDNPVPFLSTVDLLKMRKEQYFPYFLNKDKTLLPKYNKESRKEKSNGSK